MKFHFFFIQPNFLDVHVKPQYEIIYLKVSNSHSKYLKVSNSQLVLDLLNYGLKNN